VYGSETRPWGVKRIRAYCLWDNNNDTVVDEGANAGEFSIAVIDTGIYYDRYSYPRVYHPDLEGNVYPDGIFFYCSYGQLTSTSNYWDYLNHGTHVSGIIAATDNEIGVIGTAPYANIYVLRADGLLKSDKAIAMAAAINWSIDNHFYIISISLGIDTNYPVLQEACDRAYASGRLIIAGAGNSDGAIEYPANYSSVIAVGAVNASLGRWNPPDLPNEPLGSCFGDQLELVAPGASIDSTANPEVYPYQLYRKMEGTSMACPHVAGAAALIWLSKIDSEFDSNNDGYWQNTEVRAKLRDWALDLGDPGWDMYYGYGLINCWAPNQRPLGDINNDFEVDLKDVLEAAIAFGSFLGHPNWDPNADINIDNEVDLKDTFVIDLNYGQEDP